MCNKQKNMPILKGFWLQVVQHELQTTYIIAELYYHGISRNPNVGHKVSNLS